MVAIKYLVGLVVVVIVLILSSVIFTSTLPSATNQALNTMSAYETQLKTVNLPCDYYCISMQSPEEEELLSNTTTYGMVNKLPIYFSCNYAMLELAMFAYKTSVWEKSQSYAYLNLSKYNYARFVEITSGKDEKSSMIWQPSFSAYYANLLNNDFYFNGFSSLKNSINGFSNECNIGAYAQELQKNVTNCIEKYSDNWFDRLKKIVCIGAVAIKMGLTSVKDCVPQSRDLATMIKLATNYDGWMLANPDDPTINQFLIFDDSGVLTPEMKTKILSEGLLIKSRSWIMVPKGLVIFDSIPADMNVPEQARLSMPARTSPNDFKDSVSTMFNCFNNRANCQTDNNYTFAQICKYDQSLSNFPYIDCLSQLTLKDRVPEFNILPEHDLITNDLSCEGVFDACNYEKDNYKADCQPAWKTLITSEGSCNDISVFYYTALRTLGLPDYYDAGLNEYSAKLELGVCDLPCPCKILMESCDNFYVEEKNCYPLSRVIVSPKSDYGEIKTCNVQKQGEFTINALTSGKSWTVNQYQTDYYATYYFEKSFDDNDENDLYTAYIRDSLTRTLKGENICDAYTYTSKQELIDNCRLFMKDPMDFNNLLNELSVCNI